MRNVPNQSDRSRGWQRNCSWGMHSSHYHLLCIQRSMDVLVLAVFQHEGKASAATSPFFFLLMWRCLPIGQLLGCNGGHMRRSALVSDTDGLSFSSVFAFRRWHWQSESFSRCITGSPQIPVFLPWSLSYSWFSQLRQLPSFLIALVLSQKKKDQWIIILV